MGNRKLSGEERRQQIIDCACKVFAQKGYFNARTRDIADSCGVNEAMLYKHFSSKEDLFREVMEQIHEESVRVAVSRLNPELNGKESVLAVIKGLWDSFAFKPFNSANVLHSLALSTESLVQRDMIEDRFSMHHGNLTKLIELGKKDGSIKPDLDSAKYASILLGTGMMYSILNAIGIPHAFDPPDALPVLEEIVSIMGTSSED